MCEQWSLWMQRPIITMAGSAARWTLWAVANILRNVQEPTLWKSALRYPTSQSRSNPFLQSQPKSFPETSAQQGDLHIKQGFILILLVWVLKNAIIHLKMLKIFFLLAGSLRAPAFPLHTCVSVPPRSSSTGGGDSLRSVSTISGQTRWWLGRSCSSVEQSSAQQHQLWVNSPALPRHFTSLRLSLLAVKIG